MHEIAQLFGPDRHLVGTLTLPEQPQSRPIAFLLINAGVIHRIGPHRINVKLARHLAKLGFPSLRFDLSGQGDSRTPAQGVDHELQSVADLRAAMDHLSRTLDVQRFAVAGICSGADNGWATALADPRVVAVCQLDGYQYPTAKTARVRLRKRLRGPILRAIGPWLWRRLRGLVAAKATGAPVMPAPGRPFPAREVYARDMQSLADRDVQLLLLFSGSLLPQYNHPEQFRDAFAGHAFVDKVEAQYCPELDHTLTPLGAQQELLRRVGDWAAQLK